MGLLLAYYMPDNGPRRCIQKRDSFSILVFRPFSSSCEVTKHTIVVIGSHFLVATHCTL